MKQTDHFKCPLCGSNEFMTMPNRYDILSFRNGKFQILGSEVVDDKERVFCRGCSAEIDVDMAISCFIFGNTKKEIRL